MAMASVLDAINPGRRAARSVRRENALAALFLLVVLLVLLRSALPDDRVLSPAAMVFDTPVFAGLAPEHDQAAENELLFDQVYQFTPWRTFARDELLDGRLPLWNPYSSTGAPLVATMQAAVFYPVNLVMAPAEPGRALLLSALLRLWLAGFGTYLLVRRFGLALLPALVSATAFMLSQYLVVWLGHPHTNVAVWLPWLVLATELLLTAADRRSVLRATAFTALCTGAMLTGGHAETELFVLLTVSAYAALRGLTSRRAYAWTLLVRRGAVWVLALLLGAGIAAVQLLPFLEWLPLSAEYNRRSGQRADLWQLDFLKGFPSLLAGIYPQAFGNPTWAGGYWSFNPWSSFNEGALSIGVIPLILAVSAVALGFRQVQVRIWTIIGGVALGLALHLPVLDLLNGIPPLSLANAGRLRLIAAFSLAVLAGYGAQLLVDGAAGRRARNWFTAGASLVAVLGVALFLLSGLLLPWSADPVAGFLDEHMAGVIARGETLPRSLAICQTRVPACLAEISAAYRFGQPELYLPLLVATAALLCVRLVPRARLLPVLLGLTALELVVNGSGYNPTLAEEDYYPEPPIFAEAARLQDRGRVVLLQQTAYPDVQLMYGVRDIRGLDYPLARYSDYLDATGDRIPWINNGVLIRTVASPLTRALGVSYVLTTPGELPWAGPNLVEVARDGEVVLARVPDALPRGRLVQQAMLVAGDDAALTELRARPEAILDRVVLIESEAAQAAVDQLGATTSTSGSAVLVLDEPRRQIWQTSGTAPALLVVADAYYPGWSATLDGAPVDVLRANVAFRAVAVPGGAHTVEFRYEPRSVTAGLWISIASLVVALSLLAVSALPWPLRHAHRGS